MSDLLLMYINHFQGQQDKVTFEMLSQEMDLYSSKIILIHARLFIMEEISQVTLKIAIVIRKTLGHTQQRYKNPGG